MVQMLGAGPKSPEEAERFFFSKVDDKGILRLLLLPQHKLANEAFRRLVNDGLFVLHDLEAVSLGGGTAIQVSYRLSEAGRWRQAVLNTLDDAVSGAVQ